MIFSAAAGVTDGFVGSFSLTTTNDVSVCARKRRLADRVTSRPKVRQRESSRVSPRTPVLVLPAPCAAPPSSDSLRGSNPATRDRALIPLIPPH